MDSIGESSFENDIIDVSSLPRFEEVELHSFSRNYLLKRNISTSIWLVIISVGIFMASQVAVEFRPFVPYVIAAFTILFAWSFLSNFLWFRKSGYAMRDRDIIYKRGFLFEKTTVVPFNRVQHVSTNRGVLDKLLNLSALNVFTAGGSGSDVSLPGLHPETADSLKESLAARMSGHV